MSWRPLIRAGAVTIVLSIAMTAALAMPASAQEAGDVVGEVDISFDVGGFDPDLGDWVVEVVEVTGELTDGQEVTIELRGEGDRLLWSATRAFSAPTTRIDVTTAVAVGDVTSAGVAQELAAVEGVQIEPPAIEWSTSGGGGSGQLALSMVMAVVIVAIIFRTPLPSASTERWTK